MAERIASVRQNRLRFRPARPAPKLQASIVIRWKCPRCGTIHLDRSERNPESYSPAKRRPPGHVGHWCWDRPNCLASTTVCCGEDWCFLVTPLPEHVEAWERERSAT